MHPLVPWLQTFGVVLLAMTGTWLGLVFARRTQRWWWTGYAASMVIIALMASTRWIAAWEFQPPISWLTATRRELVILAFLGPFLFASVINRLPQRGERIAVIGFVAAVVLDYCAGPFLGPAFNRGELSRLQTSIDVNGICRQQTGYTCGPASAVTGLHRLGFEASEGELAILAGTSSMGGTPPDVLAAVLQNKFGKAGLNVTVRSFRSVEELTGAEPVLAVMKFGLLVDHYVAVLQVKTDRVIVGDPLLGREEIPRVEFEKQWRHVGIVLGRAAEHWERQRGRPFAFP